MKRSRNLRLGLMLGAAGLALAGCQEEEKATGAVYSSVEACVSEGIYTRNACETALAEATKVHEESAPRYDSRALCEEEFGVGQCSPGSDGGSFFVPFMTGYFVSSVLDDIGDAAKRTSYSRPLYKYKDGNVLTASGGRLSVGSDGKYAMPKSAVTVKPAPAKVMNRTAVVSRGGFGAKAGGSFGG